MRITFHKAMCWTLIVSLLQGVSAPAVLAACGGAPSGGSGPPSISATEISTSQALELLRKRREESIQTASLGPVTLPASVVTTAPAPSAAPAVVQVAAPAPAPVAPATPPTVVAAPPPVPAAPAAAPAQVTPPAPAVAVVTPAPTAPAITVAPGVATPTAPPIITVPAQPAPAAPVVAAAPATAPAQSKQVTPTIVSPARPVTPGIATPSIQPSTQRIATVETVRPTVVTRAPQRPSKDPAPATVDKPAPSTRSVVHKAPAPEPVRPLPTRGSWGEVFGDVERESGLTYDGSTIGGLKSSRVTAGFVSGTDWRVTPSEASRQIILGLMSSSFQGKTRFNDLTYLTPSVLPPLTSQDLIERRGAEETASGLGVGTYALAATERWSLDVMARVDRIEVEQRDVTRFLGELQADGTFIPCSQDTLINRSAAVDYLAFVVAANFNLRHKLGATTTLEPTIGFRATFIDYDVPTGTLPLAVQDGSILRLQAGARLIDSRLLHNGDRASLTLTGLLYSDVRIDGLTPLNSFGFNASAVNEGKLRALGSVGYSIARQDGWTFTAQGEVRGGENLLGAAAKLSARFEW